MRQDKRFHPGEAVSSTHFAKLLSDMVDWLVTVDPHLHRHHTLDEIFRIPTFVVHAAAQLAFWIRTNVTEPVLIGPDSESEQWVASVAAASEAPYVLLAKVRHGDRDVEVSAPDLAQYENRAPVLVDDIISTGRTMAETINWLSKGRHKPAICVGVHAIFAEGAYAALHAAGAGKIVTTNAIPHESNAVDVIPAIADAVRKILRDGSAS